MNVEDQDMFGVMRRAGSSAAAALIVARFRGLEDINCIRMLRTVYGLTLRGAKEIMIQASAPSTTLDAHEEAVGREIVAALEGGDDK